MKHDITAPTTEAILVRTAEIDHLRAELARRDVTIIELRQALDDASGPHCPSCGNSINPDMCHCGAATNDPGHDNHAPVPMGCVCGYTEPDWQALAMTRGGTGAGYCRGEGAEVSMTAPAGAVVGLYVDLISSVAVGDIIETQSGRRYRVLVVREQQRGKHKGRQHMRCLVLAADDDGAPGDVTHRIRWYSRDKRRA